MGESISQVEGKGPAPKSSPLATVGRLVRDVVETVLLALLIYFAVHIFIENYQVLGPSMEPNLHTGQFLLVSKAEYWFHSPQRGDVVVFPYPQNPTRNYIKRVIGLPGETVRIQNGVVYVDGTSLDEPYVSSASGYAGGPWEIGEDEYFVLGDNRANSSDSRNWGTLSRSEIIGRAWFCYWPPAHWSLVPHYAHARAETP